MKPYDNYDVKNAVLKSVNSVAECLLVEDLFIHYANCAVVRNSLCLYQASNQSIQEHNDVFIQAVSKVIRMKITKLNI